MPRERKHLVAILEVQIEALEIFRDKKVKTLDKKEDCNIKIEIMNKILDKLKDD